ncbi:DUF2634 domain-containing protein [Fusobacterium ulcerans]|uniref:Protein of uncharacterized function (DUF2634) n=1 Tax=Fusobacterium ulcerans TaxID=861 RepID=A0AAX2J8R4_9FUSO|nr:DUF2634 domain-containing protein [Fusobacterium ulcerans]AVQ28853.1 DUF2634 domain-containing protein [Fusobacterium ulcerans]EFS26337.1 hypothetical protein FUAG_01852 [Fusobacterium ulcerans ATCC 49185]SQJ01006.1 Protein of uncharacterised function (DUF2634) [Fusobacterium ulcerans]
MSIFPSSLKNNKTSGLLDNKSKIEGYKDILFDFESKKVVVKDGNTVVASKKQQLQQWIYLLINTEMEKFNVYKDTEFGIVFLYAMRGHEYYSSGFTIAQIKDELTEKIEKNSSIKKVEDIEIEINFNEMVITIMLIVDEDKIESEVIINV